MFRNGVSALARGFSSAALAAAVVLCALSGLLATEAAAQGPPAGVQGVGVVMEGDLDVVYEDYEDTARLLYFLNADNRRIPLRFQNGAAPDLPTGARVRVAGTLADGTLTVTTVSTVTVSTSRTLGPKSVLIVLLNFSNNTTQSFTSSTIASVNQSVTDYYIENTYAQTEISFTVAGWFTIAATNSTCSYGTWASQADAAAANAGYTLSAYDRRVYAFPSTGACGWTGLGYLSGAQAFLNGSYRIRTLAHELGHTFGAYHSHANRCDTNGCTYMDYGNDRDVMGSSGVVGHLNAFQKERLGWLNYGLAPPTQVVITSGQYWVENFERLGTQPKALKVWNPLKGIYYYMESRAKVGFDSSVAAGVTVHTAKPTSGDSSFQVDLAPVTTTWDSTLDVGQTFSDAEAGLFFTTLVSNSDGALVAIDIGSIACSSAAPGVSLTPSSQVAAAGSSALFTVRVTNNDGVGCAPAPLTLSTATPSGWSGVSSLTLGPLAPGATVSASLTLAVPNGASGTFPFSVTADNNNSGMSATANGSVSAATGLDVAASAAMASGKGGKAVTISVDVKIGSSPVASAPVSAIVRPPSGGTVTLNGTTGADGRATLKYSVRAKDPSGTYQVAATASLSSISGSATTMFTVP